ncbi:MAG: hypothetical protein WAW36_18995 [Methylovulum miyakonense]|uniref:hypothetical protein n=1 Tax=Methylovulum miyakonense TaxID=645578 RepID=UPI003BB4BE0F
MKTHQPTNRFDEAIKLREAKLKGAIEAAQQLRETVIAESPVPLTEQQITVRIMARRFELYTNAQRLRAAAEIQRRIQAAQDLPPAPQDGQSNMLPLAGQDTLTAANLGHGSTQTPADSPYQHPPEG